MLKGNLSKYIFFNYTISRRIFDGNWRMSDEVVEDLTLLVVIQPTRAHRIFDVLPKTSNETTMASTAEPIGLLTTNPSKNLQVSVENAMVNASFLRHFQIAKCRIFDAVVFSDVR